jgi:hypothetical protein
VVVLAPKLKKNWRKAKQTTKDAFEKDLPVLSNSAARIAVGVALCQKRESQKVTRSIDTPKNKAANKNP